MPSRHPIESKNPKEQREVPASFLAEFNAFKSKEVSHAMVELGFRFCSSRPDVTDFSKVQEGRKVTYEGERANGDGTKITIIFEKGAQYKSPQEIADEEAVKKE